MRLCGVVSQNLQDYQKSCHRNLAATVTGRGGYRERPQATCCCLSEDLNSGARQMYQRGVGETAARGAKTGSVLRMLCGRYLLSRQTPHRRRVWPGVQCDLFMHLRPRGGDGLALQCTLCVMHNQRLHLWGW